MEFWVARRRIGNLYLFFEKPSRLECGKCVVFTNNYVDTGIKIDKNMCSEVTFENSPQKVRLELVKEEEV